MRALLAAVAMFVAVGSSLADDASRPNVIVVMTDDQGFGDVGFHGNDRIRTPHLDRFAAEGTELTRFYVEPVCAPTRASLMTGRSYYRTGVIHTSRGGAKMHGDERTIAELLRAAGYRTGIFGKWHLGDIAPMRPGDQGFEESLVHASGGIGQTPDVPNSYTDPWLRRNGRRERSVGYCTDVFFTEALRFVERHREEPFFVYIPTNAPHTPLEVPESYAAPYREAGLDDTTTRVYGMVTNIDDNLGRMLRRLAELGLRENTLVLFLTDNGAQQRRFNGGLRGRKSMTYEGGVRVPCLAQWPARWEGGRRIDTLAAHIDVVPTLLEVCGVHTPDDLALDGRSLVATLDDGTAWEDDRAVFVQCHRGLEPTPGRNAAVVTQRWKLVLGPGTFSEAPEASEPLMELYDLLADPGESNELAAEHPERGAELRKRYETWFADVRRTREFQPGRIDIGGAEAATHLCRYQDGHYVDGKPHGWDVRVVKGGRYRVDVVREPNNTRGVIAVRWNGRTTEHTVGPGLPMAVVPLAAGEGRIDIWFERDGKRERPTNNGTLGDATLRLVKDG